MNTKDRIKKYCNSLNISIKDFENSINASNGYVNSISKGIGEDKLSLIVEKYPNLDIAWLLTGIGTMIRIPSTVPMEEADQLDHEVNILTLKVEMLEKMLEDKNEQVESLKVQISDKNNQFNDQLAQKDAQINQLLQIISSK